MHSFLIALFLTIVTAPTRNCCCDFSTLERAPQSLPYFPAAAQGSSSALGPYLDGTGTSSRRR
jgi:hypothetical protein